MTPSTRSTAVRLMLVSNTGRPILAHCREALSEFLADGRSAAFVTAANLGDEEGYFAEAKASLAGGGAAGVLDEVRHLRWNATDAHSVLESAEAVIVGGGNTFALLSRLRESGLLEPLRERVLGGLPYIGSSAGANIAGPNVLTSNDWNVVALDSFDALALAEFNVNPHYPRQGDAGETPESESRDSRIGEYHLMRDNLVIGLEEGAVLLLEQGKLRVAGRARAKAFPRGQEPRWFEPGSEIGDFQR